jgi:hypothetical protein
VAEGLRRLGEQGLGLLLVLARAADVGMKDRRAVRAERWRAIPRMSARLWSSIFAMQPQCLDASIRPHRNHRHAELGQAALSLPEERAVARECNGAWFSLCLLGLGGQHVIKNKAEAAYRCGE